MNFTGDSATVSYLLENDVRETKDSDGFTAFDWAAVEGNESVLHILYNANKDVNRSMALMLAASYGRLETCQVIEKFFLIFWRYRIISCPLISM